jgi:hypothetical protein
MRVPLIVAGAAYACAVHATLSFVNFAPLLAAHFTVLYRRQFTKLPSWGTLWRAGLWFIFGAFAVTALLGIINVAVGRDFLFFKILLQFVIDLDQAQWWLPWSSGWFLKVPSLSYMASIFASLIVCTSSAILGLIARRDSVALSLQLQYVFAGALWMIWQSLGQLALQEGYPAYPLYPVMFFGLAGLAATWLPTGRVNSTSIVFSVSIAALAVLSLSVDLIGVKLLEAFGQHLELALIMLWVAFAALFAASRGREALLAVAVLAFCTWNTLGAAATGTTQAYAHGQKCRDGAGNYLALIEAHRFVTRFAVNTQDIFVWWPQGETLRDRDGCTLDLSYFGFSMSSFGLAYLASPWSGMPDIDDLPAGSFALLYGGRKVAVLSHDQANVQRLMARYARAGKELTIYGQTIIRTSRFAFNLYVLGL